MNEKITIDERIEFINEAKFTDFSSENEIYERQCMIFTVIALFSLFIHYNNFIKKARVICIKRKNQCFANSREKSLLLSFLIKFSTIMRTIEHSLALKKKEKRID